MLRLDPDEKLKPDEKDSLILISTLTSPKAIIELPTKSYVDSLHEGTRKKSDLSSVFNDQENEVDISTLNNLDSVSVNRNPTSDDELTNKKKANDSIGEGTLVRFNQTLENSLKASFGNDT